MVLSLVGAALRFHAFSAVLTSVLLVVGAWLAGLPIWLPGLAWGVLGLGSVECWYLVEPFERRLRGLRPATADERGLLGSPTLLIFVQEEDAFRFTAGLRTLVVSRGALEMCDERFLAALAAQAQAAREAGPLLVGVGAAPIAAAAWASAAVSRLGVLLAISAGLALVCPFWVWGDGFTRVAGRLFGAVLVTILGCELIAGGLVVWGVGLLTAWALAPAVQWLLAWEARRVEARADRLVVQAGLGPQLLEALEALRAFGEPRAAAPRIERLRQVLMTLAEE